VGQLLQPSSHKHHITNNKELFRFELALPDGPPATLEYRWRKAAMLLMHTIVPPAAQGQGIASELIRYVLDYARAQELKIVPYCSFVVDFLNKHPEYNDVVLSEQ